MKKHTYMALYNWRWWAVLPILLMLAPVAILGPLFASVSLAAEWAAEKINYNPVLLKTLDWCSKFVEKGRR